MAAAYWQQVVAGGLQVPTDRPLAELTAELTTMLGSPDPALRDGTARATLTTWIHRGVYDDLLAGLGDGMAAGLQVGLGEQRTDTVFRRACSAAVIGECIERDNTAQLVPPHKLLDWGDRVAAWFVRERDLRAFVDGRGWAHALAHGADAISALGRSSSLGLGELTVLLDIIADRVLMPSDSVLVSGEPERMAAATMAILRRDVVPLSILEPWVARLAADGVPSYDAAADSWRETFNVRTYLQACYLQLSIGAAHPDVRSDLLLVLVDALRAIDPGHLGGG